MKRKLSIVDILGFEDICDEFAISAGKTSVTCTGVYNSNREPRKSKLHWTDPTACGGHDYEDPNKRYGLDRGEPDPNSFVTVQNQNNTLAKPLSFDD